MRNADIALTGSCFDCSEVYTLYPNGTLRKGCPNFEGEIYMPTKCYICNISETCMPCRLHKYCSYPHKFAKLLEERRNEECITNCQ
jgi:hypothetical protein